MLTISECAAQGLRIRRSGCGETDRAMMAGQARRLLSVVPDAVRFGFLPRRSYVAPSPQSRNPAKRPKVELSLRLV